MTLLHLLGTGWTAWKVATKWLGPAGCLLVTVVAGLVSLRSSLAENVPPLAGAVGDTPRAEVCPFGSAGTPP